jgi:hypothetical protein
MRFSEMEKAQSKAAHEAGKKSKGRPKGAGADEKKPRG